ncbi:TonB-dependent siderophore receptor [Klebsiella variicola]|uniref:TonB-dependent receptor n=1 Tax=Klebsiella variicola TaxID=244366 RepID=UPI0024A6AF27|nr:TonB-dependent receptor [Klebsiella variicola]WHE61045.1 TonB-dependent siderophore receptor [Klebsiella variicola]HBW0857407.1 TonB-dependent siderophore receptor [Klebsiella variicola]HBW0863608.1 TonB-dependent siderophore receptor [Klebsiella variicola]HBW0868556.1 TonB-dependent siderophore receptor [Klebsiella variicola]
MKKRLWVLHPLLLVSSLPALAAQSDEDSIIVSANRTHRTVAEMAQTTWVIEGQEIEQQVQGGKEFKDVLAQLIPGIDVSSQGRTNYGMNMRGRAIVVLIDGVRLNSSRTDSRQLDAIDPFNIEHIEVISGATSLYGGGSTGGLINIVTKKGQQDRQVDLEVGSKSGFANSNDHDERIAAAVSGGTDHASGRLSVAYQRFGGWYDGNNDALILDNTQTGLQHSDRLDVMGTGTIEIDDNRQLQLVTQYYKSQGDDDYGLWLGKNMSAVTSGGKAYTTDGLNSDRIPGTERHLISLQYSDADFFGQNLVSQVYYRDESLTFYPFPTLTKGQVSSFSSSQQDTDQYGAKLTLNSQPLAGWDLTWGLDADHETFNANQMFFDLQQSLASGGLHNESIYTTGRYPGYSISNVAPFLQSSYDLNEIFTVSGGVRYQWTENRVDDFVGYAQQQDIANGKARSADAIKGGKTDYDNFLFNAGIVAHLTERQQTWFNFSQGVELPDPGKYYGIGKYGAAVNGHLPLISSVNVDDSPLQGIKVNSYELGWRYTGDNLRTQLAAYYSTSDKTIVVNRTDMTIDVQSDKRRIYGVEGAVDYFIPDSDWSVGGNFNVLKSQVQTDGRWQKWDVTLASPSKATAWVGWAPDPWSLRVQSQQVFDLSDAAGNKLEGYNTVDFIGSYALPVGKLTFSIENLLNEDYVTIWGQRAPLLYSPTYGSSSLYEYKGCGRTFGLNYALTF